jgi:hypothetical protein
MVMEKIYIAYEEAFIVLVNFLLHEIGVLQNNGA